MRFLPHTQVWVRCDDDVWWPATVKEMDPEMRDFLCEGEDCCVEFFHSPGELYPLLAADETRVQPLHAEVDARTVEEASWFNKEEVKDAVAKVMREHDRCRLLNSSAGAPQAFPAPSTGQAATKDFVAFSAAELRNIQSLLNVVGGSTATRIHKELRQARVSIATKDVQRCEVQEQRSRKRLRTRGPSMLPLPGGKDGILSSTVFANHEATGEVHPINGEVRETSTNALTSSVTGTSSPTSVPHFSLTGAPVEGGFPPRGAPFVPAARRRVLEVLRSEVFENPSLLVLSPVYRFVEMLGAVVVDNNSLVTTLPSPHALREAPDGGFARQRRVLLVPLTEDYKHTTGWMVPMDVEGTRLSMSLFVNDEAVTLPQNWQLSPAKEASAVKTAVAADITELVLPSKEELFSLHIIFTGDVAELEMWRGIIACIFVEEIGVATLAQQLVSVYHKPHWPATRRSLPTALAEQGTLAITEVSVKLQCPITTLTMEIPVRSAFCEHYQCMELTAVLTQCVRQNVWNCPLCGAAMKPQDININYRLRDWIASHARQLDKVEYVVETAPDAPLKVIFKPTNCDRKMAVEVIDEED